MGTGKEEEEKEIEEKERKRMIVFLVVFNFVISWFNAWATGKTWTEAKAAGGMARFMSWCGATMSACGFTWCYSIGLALVAGSVSYHGHILLTPRYVNGVIELGYMVVILPVIGSGIGITVNSWQNYRRNRSLAYGGVAAYNTFADVYNIYNAARDIPFILKDLTGLFKSEDDDNGALEIMILLVVVALAAGTLTTYAILRSSAKAKVRDVCFDMLQKRANAKW